MAPQRREALSARQAEILNYIEEQISRRGTSPTYRDIARHFGYDAVGTVQDHVRALIRKGFLKKEEGVARGLQLAHHCQAVSVPVLGTVPAGRPIEALEDLQGTLAFATAKNRGDLFALKVKGDSMIEAGIHDGDFVIVRKQTHAESGEIVVAMIDGEATVKFLEKRNGKIRLLPANPRYSPIDVPPHAENLIQGKVVSLQRFF